MTRALPPELSLAVACCRWPLVPRDGQLIRDLAECVGDWARFEAVARRNRIVPLVHRSLRLSEAKVPAPVLERLSGRAFASARTALSMARETLRLQRAFEAAGLQVLILKGVPLGILAYGELGIKESCDIDLLVSSQDAAAAIPLLAGLGYASPLAHLSRDRLNGFLRHSKEAAFVDPATGIAADLHWGLVDHPQLLRGVSVDSPRQKVGIAGGELHTLGDGELFAYLCVHGAWHNWGRLKWLADLGALLHRRSMAEIEALHRAAQGFGAGRPSALALILCRELLGLTLREAFVRELHNDRIVRALERNVLASLACRGGADEHVAYSEPWLRCLMAQFFLAPGLAYALAHAGLVWNVPVDRTRIALPRRLSFLYPWLRLPMWLGRAGGRALRKSPR